ncbi:hypothetical protein BH24ACT11_BH24ACT11_03590 [soil metagenome]
MTIHSDHPFIEPEGERRPGRRLRGRQVTPVTVWSAGASPERAGLTVSSTLVADGEPSRLIGLIDEESDLWVRLRATGRVAVSLLAPGDEMVADVFAGVAPSPGGTFRTGRWLDTEWGPALDGRCWAGAVLAREPTVAGWSLLVHVDVAHVQLVGDTGALAYYRGRYVGVPAEPR